MLRHASASTVCLPPLIAVATCALNSHVVAQITAVTAGPPYIGARRSGSGRETLCIWPLNRARMDLEEPITVRVARDEFGPASDGGAWMVDHPSGAVLRLADGDWHSVIAYRVPGSAEHKGAHPAAQTGCYVEQVLSAGPTVPPWRCG